MSLYPNPHGKMCYWYDAAEKYGAPNIKWCEETLCQVVSEPANTWSNIGYILAAFVIYLWAKKTKHTELKWLAPAMFLMGACSLYYHLSNFYISQILDFVGMYLFVFWLLVLNLRKAKLITRKMQVPAHIIISLLATLTLHYMYLNHIKFQMIIAIGVLTILICEFLAYKRSSVKRHYKYFFTGIILVGLAQLASQLDLQRIWCDPSNHVLQGHALWHLLAAIGLTISYKHWAQEDYSLEVLP